MMIFVYIIYCTQKLERTSQTPTLTPIPTSLTCSKRWYGSSEHLTPPHTPLFSLYSYPLPSLFLTCGFIFSIQTTGLLKMGLSFEGVGEEDLLLCMVSTSPPSTKQTDGTLFFPLCACTEKLQRGDRRRRTEFPSSGT